MKPNNISSIQPEINSQTIPPKIAKVFPVTLILVIVFGLISFTSIISAFYFYKVSQKNISQPVKEVVTEPITTSSPYTITWLDKPQKISSLTIFNKSEQSQEESKIYFEEASFYLVANLGDGSQLINLFLPVEGMGMTKYDVLYRFIKSTNGQISIIKSDISSQLDNYLLPQISISTFNFKELNPPEYFNVNNVYFTKKYTIDKTFETLINSKLINSSEYGDLFVRYIAKEDVPDVYYREFYLRLKDWTLYIYNQKYNFLYDSRTSSFIWNDNSKNEDQFFDTFSSGKCSSNNTNIIKDGSYLLNNKVSVAHQDYTNYYQIKDTNNSLLKKLYDLYKQDSQYITSTPLLNMDEYANAKNHFLYQDFLGDWIIFTNQKYSVQAECGKPVIYLYPEKETQIKVQVDAKITKSEPEYPQQGWDVVAKPNGELTYQNQSYPYLFWEGLGNGIYPDYKDRGFVVNQKDLVSTIYKQLSQLGLNQKESADFMEFWQSKLPTTPYVRLTWLTTKDMDNLAPLTVNPKPNTKIRLFLEFEGLEKQVSLIPQKLSAPKRTGFTLIEWGGLLLK